MTFAVAFPNIDPVAVEIGPIVIRWYALAYLAGLLLGWRYMRVLASRSPATIRTSDIDDFIIWATLGVVLGGRLGYVLFYKFDFYVQNPLMALQIWQGGMSFHGGLLGVIAATLLFAWRRRLQLLAFSDLIACAAPIGLFLGRIANFINGELYGRVTDVPWAMAFPRGGPVPRHPSQLYEAGLEGLVLFLVLFGLWRIREVRSRPGIVSGVFLVGYATARSVIEVFRQPDAHVGFLVGGTTMGQWLSVPTLLLGLFLIVWAVRHNQIPAGKLGAQRSV